MIIQTIFNFIISVFKFFLSGFPTITQLPWGLERTIGTAVSFYRYLGAYIPVLLVIMNAFIIYVTFKLGLLVLKLFLGNRAPTLN